MIISLGLPRRYGGVCTSDDVLLTLLVEAAEGLAEKFLNRKVLCDQAALDAAMENGTAGADPTLANAKFKATVQEMVSDRYNK